MTRARAGLMLFAMAAVIVALLAVYSQLDAPIPRAAFYDAGNPK